MLKKISIELTTKQWGVIVDALNLNAELSFQDSKSGYVTKQEAIDYVAACDESIALAQLIGKELFKG